MRERLKTRLRELMSEYDKGQSRLRELDAQRESVSTTLLRISGAILVLQEELAAEQPAPSSDTAVDNQANVPDANTVTPARGTPGPVPAR